MWYTITALLAAGVTWICYRIFQRIRLLEEQNDELLFRIEQLESRRIMEPDHYVS
ncbi:hypothetical protein MH117_02100 [Paenibacillus sp. ACRRX]|uniref:hypothetical protein n=1 Tax=unclassified Paenibacillus TaxID=185978 RepID=UPI001EF6B1C5|nr:MULTISPECIES: hypothetical protein [unclassified Paenibacillus]MCG7406191.1 hypothetical protein [Paenibacillus sp. ACRRX]MDK8179224.1 hypothetical protein [Paenibacillus sp. UMB4589-SE434]